MRLIGPELTGYRSWAHDHERSLLLCAKRLTLWILLCPSSSPFGEQPDGIFVACVTRDLKIDRFPLSSGVVRKSFLTGKREPDNK